MSARDSQGRQFALERVHVHAPTRARGAGGCLATNNYTSGLRFGLAENKTGVTPFYSKVVQYRNKTLRGRFKEGWLPFCNHQGLELKARGT